MVTRLQVTYRGTEVDRMLDFKILEFFNRLSFICVNRLFHPMEFRRELYFEKQTKENIKEEAKIMEEVVA